MKVGNLTIDGKQDEHYSNCIATTFDIISYMGV